MKCKFGKTKAKFLFLLLFSIMLLFNTCKKDKPNYYFTEDEKSWVFYKNNNLTYIINRKDTFNTTVEVNKGSSGDNANFEIYSNSISFENVKYDLLYATSIWIEKYENRFSFSNFDILSRNGSVNLIGQKYTIDTAIILNKVYNNVYKYVFSKSESNKLKYIYFLKGIGFIKFQNHDTIRYELLIN